MTVKAVYDGRNIVPQEPDRIAEYKRSLNEGAVLAMTMEPWEDRRTRAQQGLLHEMLGRLAREQGMSLEVVKVQLKIELGYYIPLDKLALARPKWRGRIVDLASVYDGDPETYVFLRSEADYTKRMEGEFIDRVMVACSEAGVDISDIMEALDGCRG